MAGIVRFAALYKALTCGWEWSESWDETDVHIKVGGVWEAGMRQPSKYDSGACDAGGGLKGEAPVLLPRLGSRFRSREWGATDARSCFFLGSHL